MQKKVTEMNKKTITDYLSKKEDEVITSYRINKKLHEELKLALKTDGYTFHELIEAFAKIYLGKNK